MRLQHLDLSHNDLSALPQWMTQLAVGGGGQAAGRATVALYRSQEPERRAFSLHVPALRLANPFSCRLRPGRFHCPQRLRSLSLHHNSFERFPPVLYELPALTALHMSHNRISWW